LINNEREIIQNQAFDAWLNNEKKGTIELPTGLGKTFVAFKAMLSMPKNSNCLFIAETTVK